MAFRDDREALAERVTSLERELDEVRAVAADVDRARDRVVTLERENRTLREQNDGLRRAQDPGRARFRGLALATIAILTVTAVAFAVRGSRRQDELTRCEDRVDDLEGEARDREDDYERCEVELARLRSVAPASEAAVPRTPAAAHPPYVDADHPDGILAAGIVTAVEGEAPVSRGTPCNVAIAFQPDQRDCHASVRCGAIDVYPRTGEGLFSCSTRDDHVGEGADLEPSALSGDPMLRLDADARRVVITDTAPDWSVTITWVEPPLR